MKRLLIPIIALMLLVTPVFAFDVFGASGAQDTGKDFIDKGTVNIANWPQKAQDYCKKAQDNAIKSCADYAERLNLNPGGWWVMRTISAKSFTPRNPSIVVNVEDAIVGKWDCPPHDLIVDREGKLVLQEAIHSETVLYGKTNKTTGTKFGTEDESLEIACSFSCGAWPCIEYKPNNRCEDHYFTDPNGDGRSNDPGSNNGKTKEQAIDRVINGEPTKEGGYYYGMKMYCEGEEKIPWWQIWKEKKCKITNCTTEEIPYANHPDTKILRTCCGCTCENFKLIPSIDVTRYVPLTTDPFAKVFNTTPKDVSIGREIENKTATLIRDGTNVPPVVGFLIGSEQVNVAIAAEDKEVKYGLLVTNGALKEVKKDGYTNPSITLTTTSSTFDRIKNSGYSVPVLLAALRDGSIKQSSTTTGGAVKIALAGLVIRIAQIVQPPVSTFTVSYDTPAKQITYEGYPANLIASPKNVALIYPIPATKVPPNVIAVNPSGSLIGYTSQKTQTLIASKPQQYSATAGIYTQTTTAYKNYQSQTTTTTSRLTIPTTSQTGYKAMYVAATAYTAQRAAVTSKGSASYAIRIG
ncbi:MAG: hypothetical protein V1722_02225 [Candidatus Micrarchaeota archaeon]